MINKHSDTFFVGLVNCENEPDKEINAIVEDKWTVQQQNGPKNKRPYFLSYMKL